MKKWEYKIINSHSFKKPGIMKEFSPADVESHLNKIGQDGWEIIYFDCKFKVKEIETFAGIAKREASAAAVSPQKEAE